MAVDAKRAKGAAILIDVMAGRSVEKQMDSVEWLSSMQLGSVSPSTAMSMMKVLGC